MLTLRTHYITKFLRRTKPVSKPLFQLKFLSFPLGSDTTVPGNAQSVLFSVPQKRPCYLDNYLVFFVFFCRFWLSLVYCVHLRIIGAIGTTVRSYSILKQHQTYRTCISDTRSHDNSMHCSTNKLFNFLTNICI